MPRCVHTYTAAWQTAEAQGLCHETLSLGQYIDIMPGATLPKWVVAAEVKPVLSGGVLCLFSSEPQAVYVCHWYSKMDSGKYARHFGYKKTLANLQQRYIWETMARGVANFLRACTQCWQYPKGRSKKVAIRSLHTWRAVSPTF